MPMFKVNKPLKSNLNFTLIKYHNKLKIEVRLEDPIARLKEILHDDILIIFSNMSFMFSITEVEKHTERTFQFHSQGENC